MSGAAISIYLDHAASTPMRPEAVDAMQPFLADSYGNPSGGHRAAMATKHAVEAARERIAARLGVRPDEIVFTGGGSEADNLAVKGAGWAGRNRGLDGVVVSGIEHKAVLGAAERLRREGSRLAQIGADANGVVDLGALGEHLDERTAVVSVMTVNNETGIVQPIEALVELVRARAPQSVVHTDAVQAPQWIELRTLARTVDLLAISGHKFGGPKGVGVLVVRKGVELVPLIEGGGHEWSIRAGTQNVAGIVALAAAFDATDERRDEEGVRIAALRDRLEVGLRSSIDDLQINGDPKRRVAGLLHIAVADVEAELLLTALDQAGVCAASGSSCSSGAIDPSHVLMAMGMSRPQALSSVRFSLGWASTAADVDAALPIIRGCISRLREATS